MHTHTVGINREKVTNILLSKLQSHHCELNKKKTEEKNSFKYIYLFIAIFKTIRLENRKLHTHIQGPGQRYNEKKIQIKQCTKVKIIFIVYALDQL